MILKFGERVGAFTSYGVVIGKIEEVFAGGWFAVRGDDNFIVEVRKHNIFPIWKGVPFERKGFSSLSDCLHSVGLRSLETSARKMLDNLSGREIFLFCTELKEVLENGIFRKDPYCEMVVKNFLDWAAHGFQAGGNA